MNRRTLLKSIASFSTAGLAAHQQMPSVRKYGFFDVESHRAHKVTTGEDLHVFLDGVDVTSNCFEADDVNGYVCMFCTDQANHTDWTAKGAKHIRRAGGGACRLEIVGRVEFRPLA